MNYSEMVRALEQASLFDVYRLSVALRIMLEQPEKQEALKRQLRVGMAVSYFSTHTNALMNGVIEEILRNRVHVREKSSGQQWRIPLCAINVAHVKATIHPRSNKEKLTRNQSQVGEVIGFLGHNAQETYGTIVQLNPKTASIRTREGERWRVYDDHIFKVLDGQAQEGHEHNMIDITSE